MLTREEIRLMAIGQYVVCNPTAELKDWKTYCEGALWLLDLQEKKKRDAKLRESDFKMAVEDLQLPGVKK